MPKLLKNPELYEAILADFNKLAGDNKLSGLEKLKQLHLTDQPFTIESDLLTPTMKLKRNIAKKVFEKEITSMDRNISTRTNQ